VVLFCGSGAVTIDGLDGGDIAFISAWFPDGIYEFICFWVESDDMSLAKFEF